MTKLVSYFVVTLAGAFVELTGVWNHDWRWIAFGLGVSFAVLPFKPAAKS